MPINESGNLHGNGYADTHFIIPELVQSLRVVEGAVRSAPGQLRRRGQRRLRARARRERGLTAKYTRGTLRHRSACSLLCGARRAEHAHVRAAASSSDRTASVRTATRGAAAPWGSTRGASARRHVTASPRSAYARRAITQRGRHPRRRLSRRADRLLRHLRLRARGATRRASRVAGDIETQLGDTIFKQQVFVIVARHAPARELHRLPARRAGAAAEPARAARRLARSRRRRARRSARAARRGWRAQGVRPDRRSSSSATSRAATGSTAIAAAHRGGDRASLPDRDRPRRRTLGDIGLYGDANLRATPWLTLRGGAARRSLHVQRQRSLRGARRVAPVEDQSRPATQSCLDAAELRPPSRAEPATRRRRASRCCRAASLLVGPFAGRHARRLSYGQGHAVDRSQSTSPRTSRRRSPASRPYEAGVIVCALRSRDVELVARSVFFRTHVDRDLIFSETEGRNVLGERHDAHRMGRRASRADGVVLRRSGEPHARPIDVRRHAAPRPVRARRGHALGHRALHELPLEIRREEAAGRAAAGRHVRRAARAAVRRAQRDHLHGRRLGHARAGRNFELGLVATNLLDRRYRLGEYNFASDFRSESRLGADARARSATSPPARRARIFVTFGVNFGGGVMRVGSLSLRPRSFALSCVGTHRRRIWSRFHAAAAGPSDAKEGQPLAFTIRRLAGSPDDGDAARRRGLPRSEPAGLGRAGHELHPARDLRGPGHARARRQSAFARAAAVSGAGGGDHRCRRAWARSGSCTAM